MMLYTLLTRLIIDSQSQVLNVVTVDVASITSQTQVGRHTSRAGLDVARAVTRTGGEVAIALP